MNNQDLTILIVDDVEENVTLINRYLQMDNYNVLTANDGRQALDLLQSSAVDLVLLDINMPQIDGITTLKSMQADAKLANTPVIMLTAMDDRDTALDCLRMGACGYVTKPFSMKALRQQLDYCLNKSQADS